MKRSCFALAGIAVLALSPVAAADPVGCDALARIVGAAPDGFSAIQAVEVDGGLYETDLPLDGATQCGLDLSSAKQYYCSWRFAAADTVAVQAKVKELAESARGCFAAWSGEKITGQPVSGGRTILLGLGLNGSGGDAGTQLRIYAVDAPELNARNVVLDVTRR